MYEYKFSFFIILSIFVFTTAKQISIEQGKLTGKLLQSRNGSNYLAYLGIPFAKPPVGELRFQPPQPPDPWKGVKNAIEFSPHCIQKDSLSILAGFANVTGEEDCLYLNVFIPARKSEKPLSVIMFIHGGGLTSGASAAYIPKYFMDYDIVMVTIQYRLSILGFLSTGDEVVPGNNGMKDQIAALKWIQKNIAAFGGDPNSVTIFGQSAGATSVHLLMYSALSKGLFHRAISQSGSALPFWAYTPREVARSKAQAIGVLTGCTTETSKKLVHCLKKLPAAILISVYDKIYIWDFDPIIPFSFVDEPDIPGAFLTKHSWYQEPLNAVPWISGSTSAEGIFKAARHLHNGGKLAKQLNENYKSVIPIMFHFIYHIQSENKISEVTEAIKYFYFKEKQIGFETSTELVNMFSDAYFNYAINEAVVRHKNVSFLYYYDHRNEFTFTHAFGQVKNDLGVCHGDDILSVFPFPLFPREVQGKDLEVSKRMINYWINFIQTGNPNNRDESLWQPVTGEDLEYLHITTDKDIMKTGLLKERYSFWKNLNIFPPKKCNYYNEL